MPLIINEEQQMLKNSANQFLTTNAPVAALRKLRDEKNDIGYDPQLWQSMADMGWAGLTIPESHGGLGFGYTGLGQVLEEMGRTLTASPMIATVVLGATIIEEAGNAQQKDYILEKIVSGQLTLALAYEEYNSHRPLTINTTARKNGDNYILNGTKKFVLDGHTADQFIVTAKTDEGISLFIVDVKSSGIQIDRTIMMDSRNAATIHFDNVLVPEGNGIGVLGEGAAVLEKTLDIARICLSAEMLGTIQEAFERTITYLKERQQFGLSIGSFQGLQHRAADMFCEIELCKSVVLNALQAIDRNDNNLATLASICKAKTGEVIQLVTNEAIQMFGGIGMTDEEEIGFFMKRARVAQQTFGDYHFHYERFAGLEGF